MGRIKKRIPVDLPFSRKIDFGTSLKLQRHLHEGKKITRIKGAVTQSRKLGETNRIGAGRIRRRQISREQKVDLLDWRTNIDDRISVREYFDLFLEENPDLLDENLAVDVTLKEITEIYEPIDTDGFDGIEHVLIKQTNQRAGKKRGHFNTYSHMKNELTYMNAWREAYYNPLRGHGILMTRDIWGVTGDSVLGYESLFFDDYRYSSTDGVQRIGGASDEFIRTTRDRGDFSTDICFPMKLNSIGGEIQSMIMFLENNRKPVEIKLSDDN